MEVFKKDLKVSISFVVSAILLLLLLISLIVCFSIKDPNNKWGDISGGLAAGLTVAIMQFAIAWQDYKRTDKLCNLKLLDILYRRDNRSFYANYIKSSTKEIKIMGVTAIRFFNDFADNTPNAPEESKVLFKALENGVSVKLLLPESTYLNDTTKKEDSQRVGKIIQEIQKQYSNIKVLYFKHIPSHSIFLVDDTCIVGPVFPYLESKNTPALFLKDTSPIAIEYLKYFQKEWEELDGEN